MPVLRLFCDGVHLAEYQYILLFFVGVMLYMCIWARAVLTLFVSIYALNRYILYSIYWRVGVL